MSRKHYIDAIDLQKELQTLHTTKVMSDRLAEMLYLMCDRILCHSNFKNYDADLKEEMKQQGIFACMKYLHNCDAYNRTPRQCFNYCTTVIVNAYKLILREHYAFLNTKRQLTQQYVEWLASEYSIQLPDFFKEV